MAAGRPWPEAVARHLARQRLDMATHGIVALVAMDVDGQTALGSDAAEVADALGPLLHRALEMRDAADDLQPHVERTDQVLAPGRAAVEAVLRKRNQLQVQIGRDAALQLQHCFHPAQVVGRGIDMAADRQQAHADRPIAIGQAALDHLVDAGKVAQLAPKGDPLQQCARRVDPRQTIAEGRVHVEMRIHEWRADQIARSVDHASGLCLDPWCDLGDAVAADGNVGHPAIGQCSAPHDQIEHQRSPFT